MGMLDEARGRAHDDVREEARPEARHEAHEAHEAHEEADWRDATEEAAEMDAEVGAPTEGGSARAGHLIADDLYGEIPVARWALALSETPPFQRLGAVSLSDAPGELLFGRAFPTRLTHSLGVYSLARLARPRDRALQVAAFAHDLGHGPFSHLSESLMIEQLGIDHEERSAALLRALITGLRGAAARQLSWVDVDEVAALMLGAGPDGRGALLNGLLDYDNIDNVARFVQASGLGAPRYDPRVLARGLRLTGGGEATPGAREGAVSVGVSADVSADAHGWQADRHLVYSYLADAQRNLAIRGMLRKAIDLGAQAGLITPAFFDLRDAEALALLRRSASRGTATLVEETLANRLYPRVWQADVVDRPQDAPTVPPMFTHWRERLALEERLATEAGLHPYELILSYVVSRAERRLPPILGTPAPGAGAPATIALAPPPRLALLVAPHAGSDYVRRARAAAERALAELSVAPPTRHDRR